MEWRGKKHVTTRMENNPQYVFILGIFLGVFATLFAQTAIAQINKFLRVKYRLWKNRKPGPRKKKVPSSKNVKKVKGHNIVVQRDDSMYGYSRDMFGPSLTTLVAGDNGLTPRDRILLRDGKNVKVYGSKIVAGQWTCPYTGQQINNPNEIEIDHLVPLAEAWRSGAQSWPPQKLWKFGRSESNLVAVSKKANREKSDSDISHWLPEYNTLQYIDVWISVKAEFGLTVDELEYALIDQLNSE